MLNEVTQKKVATTVSFQNVELIENKFTFFYLVDGEKISISLSHNKKTTLSREDQLSIGFNIGMCYLLELAEITLAKHIETFEIFNDSMLLYWSELYNDVVLEKLYQLKLGVEYRNAVTWSARTTTYGRISPLKIKRGKKSVVVCATGGKESLSLAKALKDYTGTGFYFLNLEANKHRTRAYEVLSEELDCFRSYSNRPRIFKHLQNEYGPLSCGVDMAHLVFNMCLFANQYRTVLIGNEYSSNFSNDIYEGYIVNHQFVKTIDFGSRINKYLENNLTTEFKYCSPFFPYFEYKIADIFFKDNQWHDIWTSCNKTTETVNFCSNCHKCAFTYLLARKYRDHAYLSRYFSVNMFENIEIFQPLIDFLGIKPLDCVGEKTEVWVTLNDILAEQSSDEPLLRYYEKKILPAIKNDINRIKNEISIKVDVTLTTDDEVQKIIDDLLV